MDILIYRGTSGVLKRKVNFDFEVYNPILTKPSACLTIRSLIERYARGEVGFVPQTIKETTFDDDVVPVRDYSSELDKAQRVADFREVYQSKLSEHERANQQTTENHSEGDNGTSNSSSE